MADTVGIYEYARGTGYSPKHIYEQIRMGKIPAQKMGKRGVWRIAKAYYQGMRKAERQAGQQPKETSA